MNQPQQMMQSWRTNADAWTNAVRDRQIESRRLITDAAIVTAILQQHPQSVLDVGCGEGWLCRALAESNIQTVGIDASPELIDRAKALGGQFYVSRYDAIPELEQQFETIVCNFSLLEADLDEVIQQFRKLLSPQGRLLIQTVHPDHIAATEGWLVESFTDFGAGFTAPMPWYFRPRASWEALLTQNGFVIESIGEPVHPITQNPLSLLLTSRH
jgi:2-polyprenyl-3-methyl-5-hydroxy-6-metoxy-1,4-benzoquinol methylase